MPRWSGFHHFNAVMKVSFTDGSKFNSISRVNRSLEYNGIVLTFYFKICLFTLHNIITKRDSPMGYILLKVLRQYIVMYMFLALVVVIEDHLEEGRAAAQVLGEAIEVCVCLT